MNPLMNSVGSNTEGKLNCINAVVITHNNKSRQQTGLVFLSAASQRECSDFFARNRGSRRFINAEIVAIFTKNGLQFSYADGK